MTNNYKNRALIWLMWLVPIAMTGWWSVIVWTVIQIILCYRYEQKEIERQVPLRERKDVIEMNKPENLTEQDKRILAYMGHGAIKVKEGEYIYDRK